MAVRPQVFLFFPCAHAQVDQNNNSITIVDPVRLLYLPQGVKYPFSCGPMFFYVSLGSGMGKFHCRVEVRDEDSNLIAATKPKKVEFTPANRFDGVEFILRLPGFELPRAGVYEVGFYVNYFKSPLAAAVIRYVERS